MKALHTYRCCLAALAGARLNSSQPLQLRLPVRCFSAKAPTVSDLLMRKQVRLGDYLIFKDETLQDGLRKLSDLNVSSLLVVEREAGSFGTQQQQSASSTVLGLVTAHDLMRELTRHKDTAVSLRLPVSTAMTPSSRLVHIRPDEPVAAAAQTMAELHVTHLPCVSEGKCHGIVTLGDVADILSRRGGKEAAVSIVAHRGISEGTRVVLSEAYAPPAPRRTSAGKGTNESVADQDRAAEAAHMLHMRTGVAATPRYPKRGVEKPSEDAYFTAHVAWPLRGSAAAGHTQPYVPITYIGVADGVGSWWQHGVDPRQYATALMQECSRVIWHAAVHLENPPSPLEVLAEAWQKVAERKVVGSATAVVISLDPLKRQLVMHGVGDCGVILLRDTDVNRVGSLLRGGGPGAMRGGFRVAARATQQLSGFNMPYQLGYSPDRSHGVFQRPADGETLVLPVRAEDIVLAGSDGLFDNMDETDILSIVESWDKHDLARRQAERAASAGSAPKLETGAVPRLLDGGSAGLEALALALTKQAQEFSTDKMRDGPFARLAKENDILWTHGGRPDDVTCVLARISDKPPINLSSSDARTSVPGGAVGGLGGSPYGGPAILEQRLRALVPQDGAQVLCMQ